VVNSFLAGGVVVVGNYFLAYIIIPPKFFPPAILQSDEPERQGIDAVFMS